MVNSKLMIVLLLSLSSVIMVYSSSKCVGCVQQLEGDDKAKAETTLQNSLNKLAAGDGPTYTLVKVNSVSSQVVSGILYKFDADLKADDGSELNCQIEIWSQPWLENGIRVTFNCPGQEKIEKYHSA